MSHSQVRQLSVRVVTAIVIGSLSAPVWASAGERLRAEAGSYRAEGMARQQHGDIQGAIALFQKAVHLDPSYPAPHNDLGIIYESQGRLDEAEREYHTALALNPGYAQAHTNLALLYERQGKKDAAGYHWMQRYQLGAPDDPWTQMAKERLVALGMMAPEPQPAPQATSAPPTSPAETAASALSPQQRAAQDQLDRFDVILREFEVVTDPTGTTWGKRP